MDAIDVGDRKQLFIDERWFGSQRGMALRVNPPVKHERVLVPELNTGQLLAMLRSTYLIPAEGLNRVAGRPFRIGDIEAEIGRLLETERTA